MEHEFKGYALVLQDGADPLTTGGVAAVSYTHLTLPTKA